MFENITKIDWPSLKQAHGVASHVPEAIKNLVASDEDSREQAYWKLDNHVVLQSDLYEAAYYVIPFLVEILRSNISLGREHVYTLLSEIANGYAPEENIIMVNGTKTALTDACRELVIEHIDIYLDEVENRNSLYRLNALDLLMSFSEKSEQIKSALNNVLKVERDPEVIALIIEVLKEIESK